MVPTNLVTRTETTYIKIHYIHSKHKTACILPGDNLYTVDQNLVAMSIYLEYTLKLEGFFWSQSNRERNLPTKLTKILTSFSCSFPDNKLFGIIFSTH